MRETVISLLDDVQYQGNSVRTSTNYIQNDEIADYMYGSPTIEERCRQVKNDEN